MAKAYWIGHVDIQDAESYKRYIQAGSAAVDQYGGRFLVRGGASELVEGAMRSRHVIVEFPDFARAVACYCSPEYSEARAVRLRHSIGDIVIVEGVAS
jgi:uncharacterized protein (DUF1330 family)